MDRIEKTASGMIPGRVNCTQSILKVFGQDHGLDEAEAMVLGRPFGGGLAGSGALCGYISGAVLVLAKAFDHKDEAQARQRVFKAVQEFLRRFSERHHALECRALLGADMSTESGRQRIKAEKLTQRRCPDFGRTAATILSELLAAC